MTHDVIVYQFGKVASTSIVSTLNSIDGFEAYQSHFLGREALHLVLDSLLDPNRSDYFIHHNKGQLLENIDIQRIINRHKAGNSPDRKLSIITLSRDPMEWFRSAITQDIDGYLEAFRRICQSRNRECDGDGQATETAIREIMTEISDVIRRFGGVDYLGKPGVPFSEFKETYQDKSLAADIFSFYLLFLRPFAWFDQHFRKSIGLDIFEMENINKVYFSKMDWCDVFLLKYEDLRNVFPTLLIRLGATKTIELNRENASESKRLSSEINSAFSTPEAAKLRRAMASKYCAFFEYSTD